MLGGQGPYFVSSGALACVVGESAFCHQEIYSTLRCQGPYFVLAGFLICIVRATVCNVQ
jgi:hypothetical protein